MYVNIKLGHVERPIETIEVIDALVDTGATFTSVPRSLANDLGLPSISRRRVRSATGVVELEESYALIEMEGRRGGTPIVINDTYSGVLIGVLTLEALGFAVDPGTGKLRDSEILLL